MNKKQKRAVEIACLVMKKLSLKPGQKEIQISDWIKQEISKYDAQLSFDPIVAAGERSIDPHAKPSNKKIKKGEQVVVDLGAKYKGYCSDITRTFFIGKPNNKFKGLYNLVKDAQAKAIKAVKDGAYCREVDITAREIIRRYCFKFCHIGEKNCSSDCFTHTTGHGVGKKIHQNPRISLKSRKKLKAGMVITVEPGIYLKDWGGIRIEDMVEVTKKGHKLLTKAPK